MPDLKVAVAGIGFMGFSHLRVYSEIRNCNVVGVIDPSKESREKAEKTFRVKTYADAESFLKENEVDAVSVAVPTQFHYDTAKIFLEHGINTLVEKPMTTDLKQADDLIKTAAKNDAILMAGHIERFNPMVRKVKSIFSEKDNISFCSAFRMNPPGRGSDSAILDLSTHDIDVLRYITGSEIKEIDANSINRNGVEAHVVSNVMFANGVKGLIVSSLLYPIKKRELSVLSADILVEGNYITQDVNIYRKRMVQEPKTYVESLFGTIEYEIIKPQIQRAEPLRIELEHFLDCVKNRKKPIVDGEEGKKAIEAAMEIMRICKSKQ